MLVLLLVQASVHQALTQLQALQLAFVQRLVQQGLLALPLVLQEQASAHQALAQQMQVMVLALQRHLALELHPA